MPIHIETSDPTLTDFWQIAAPELQLQLDESGEKMILIQRSGSLKIVKTPTSTTIFYQEKAHLFRALVLWVTQPEATFTFEEQPQFKEIGPMIDLSRNAVLTIEQAKRFILLCGKMGLNTCLLYMEDTYEIPEFPYFGYLKGRYTQKQLQELDQYAQAIGIELVPAIQTLAHLTNPLKWGFAKDMKDTSDILLVDAPKTYQFIEAALTSIQQSFSTDKIHIGMDEAHQLGKGTYFEEHGPEDRFSIMTKHLQKVVAICNKLSLKPMMWSDMFFRLGSKTGDYYDPDVDFPEDLPQQIPEVTMVYWDYYHHDEARYQQLFRDHQQLQRPVIFAGGIWTWNGLAPNYGKTIATSRAGLSAAKKANIQTIYATLWGDDGGETPLIASLLGLQLFAEYQFHPDPTITEIAAAFRRFHQLAAEDFLLLSQFDQTPGVPMDNPSGANPSKLVFYQDLLFGLYDQTLAAEPLKAHYQQLAKELQHVQVSADTQKMFHYYQQLAEVLSNKADFGHTLHLAYQTNDLSEIQSHLHQATQLKKALRQLYDTYRSLWFEWNQPFGFEIMDLRYGALMNRIDTTIWRLSHYLDGSISVLPELIGPRLPYDELYPSPEGFGRNLFHGIYSPSKISDV
ncbi:beta-N-acetylhexosaminidase [Enterococcus sp. RIT-PI-f]|uniref:beta-N-acetylhexosaminidase n=1 Tax=Enterococcus sp. RIT-PI-f TaxID=1690244 RepID=UPI0006B8AE26|nr:beta-N-acetylhexosaminidase [Enterococcus sp. RIT-PI-f]KPG70575.1 glycosyl hydrolase family 20 [Enterococcus sp. RIT-PI-f]